MDEQEGFLSGLDDFWLRVEHPRRLMTVSGLWMFEKRLDSRRVYQSINELCDRFPRYAMVPANASLINTAEWTPARGWEPRMNVMHHQLKEPTEQALQDYVADQVTYLIILFRTITQLYIHQNKNRYHVRSYTLSRYGNFMLSPDSTVNAAHFSGKRIIVWRMGIALYPASGISHIAALTEEKNYIQVTKTITTIIVIINFMITRKQIIATTTSTLQALLGEKSSSSIEGTIAYRILFGCCCHIGCNALLRFA